MCFFLKRWGDALPCDLEVKGGVKHAEFEFITITAQYSIREYFTEQGQLIISEDDLEALKSRYKESHITIRQY